MPPAANGAGSGPPPPAQRGSPPVSRSQVIGAIAWVAGTAIAGIVAYLAKKSVWFLVLIAIAAIIGVLVVIFWKRLTEWTKTWWPVPLSAAAAILAALGGNAAWNHYSADRACGSPVDLRVVAAPETVTALRAAAQAYERERCRAATITVVPEPSLTDLKTGFTSGWAASSGSSAETLYGPQPDIWIADSPIIANGMLRFVQGANPGAGLADLTIGHTVASSPVVLGLFAKDAAGAAQHEIPQNEISNGTNLPNLVTDLFTAGILNKTGDVLRAVPDTSESALLTTPALYSAPGQSAAQIEQNQLELPGHVLHTAQAFPDGTSLLCYFRDEQSAGAAAPHGAAFLLPEQAIAAYNEGSALGDSCSGTGAPAPRGWTLYPYYASNLPALDYTFVHVRWPGQDSAERYRTAEDFQQWLAQHSAAVLPGFRDPAGAGEAPLIGSLTNPGTSAPGPPPAAISLAFPSYSRCGHDFMSMVNCYDNARPQLVATLLLDVSGSMAQLTAGGLSRLAWAQQTGEGIAQLAHAQDSLSFAPFAWSVPGAGPTGPIPAPALVSDIRATVARGYDRPLAAEIENAIGSLPAGKQNIVILTDGQRVPTNPGYAETAAGLAATMRASHPGLRVFFALTSGANCAWEPVRTLTSALRGAGAGGTCVPASSASPAASAAELFTLLLQK